MNQSSSEVPDPPQAKMPADLPTYGNQGKTWYQSQIGENAEKDPQYRPYCLRCPSLVRMVIVGRFLWRCGHCGAVHEEREKAE
jgi:hypothetical protein